MSEILGASLALCGVAGISFLWGIWKAVRDLLAERAANWLLPTRQPVTFRLAQFLSFLAARVAPRRVPIWDFEPRYWPNTRHLIFPVWWDLQRWPEPEAMLAELEYDLKAEQQVLDPVRLTLPLLLEAFGMRFAYLRRLALCLGWIPVGLALYLLVIPVAILFSLTVDLDYTTERLRQGIGRWSRFVFRR
jgi:hypothetical protein